MKKWPIGRPTPVCPNMWVHRRTVGPPPTHPLWGGGGVIHDIKEIRSYTHVLRMTSTSNTVLYLELEVQVPWICSFLNTFCYTGVPYPCRLHTYSLFPRRTSKKSKSIHQIARIEFENSNFLQLVSGTSRLRPPPVRPSAKRGAKYFLSNPPLPPRHWLDLPLPLYNIL